jgi:hypothetical protein
MVELSGTVCVLSTTTSYGCECAFSCSIPTLPAPSSYQPYLLAQEDTMQYPSGESATELTEAVRAEIDALPVMVLASHTQIVLSIEPETMRFPSGEIATDQTKLVWPCRGDPNATLVSTCHPRIVWSDEPDTMRFPSDMIASDITWSV